MAQGNDRVKIRASIVTYNSDIAILQKTINSLLASDIIGSVVVLDNSPLFQYNELENTYNDPRLTFRFIGENLGYGKAHNIAIRQSLVEGVDYHLVINPDVYFEAGTLESIHSYMEQHHDIGLLMPDVRFPDGSRQHLSKLLPTPVDLILRRFIPVRSWLLRRTRYYELHDMDYTITQDIPYLSGCFMMLRKSTLEIVHGFDERFFMYFEDTDLTRRVSLVSRSVYFPGARIYHMYGKTSYKSKKVLMYHIKSAFQYFNKWGWFFDRQRNKINRSIIKNIR